MTYAAVCREFAKDGTCRFGSKCKFPHNSGGGGNSVVGRGGSAAQGGGGSSRGRGSGRGSSSQQRGGSSSGRGASGGQRGDFGGQRGASGGQKRPVSSRPLTIDPSTLESFIALFRDSDPKSVESMIVKYQSKWAECFTNFNSLSPFAVSQILDIICKLPPSVNIDAPPIQSLLGMVKVDLAKATSSDDRLARVSAINNLVIRLYKFTWKQEKASVVDGLSSILSEANGALEIKFPTHRHMQAKVVAQMEELEKSWTIKCSSESTEIEAEGAYNSVSLVTESQWKEADVGWLSKARHFSPSLLPKFKTPDDKKSDGLYDSVEEYFDVVIKVWVALTFGEGFEALQPSCRSRDGDKECGRTMILNSSPGGSTHCHSKECFNPVAFTCVSHYHDYALCVPCHRKKQTELRGAPSSRASTHVYDGSCVSFRHDGTLYVDNVLSRKPPPADRPIHWRTTKRLASPNLVAVIILPYRGAPLENSMKIYWGDITLHNKTDPRAESVCREQGKVAINIFEIYQESFDISPNDSLIILDCQTFVPEFIPVLKALEIQKEITIPFNNGTFLNINGPYSMNPDAFAVHEGSLLRSSIVQMLNVSSLDPIIEIRRSEGHFDSLCHQIFCLVESATLDNGQLMAFFGAIAHQVHLSQGPPGTGKSYLGVVICRAMLIIRKLWIQVSPTVGSPPILVLSYKNHAIDEFLLDLIKSEPRLDMVRIGNSAGEPRLASYGERNTMYSNVYVKKAQEKLRSLHALRPAPKQFLGSHLKIHAANPFLHESIDRKVSYEATATLMKILGRIMDIGENFENIGSADLNLILNDFLIPKHSTDLFEKLYEGIQHIDPEMDVSEVLYQWLKGYVPPPQCRKVSEEGVRCLAISRNNSELCEDHFCNLQVSEDSSDTCGAAKSESFMFCDEHRCLGDNDCEFPRLVDQTLCHEHACFKCVEANSIAEIAQDDPPRHVCFKHKLCVFKFKDGNCCSNVMTADNGYCADHQPSSCKGKTNKGNQCTSRFVTSKDVPFCRNHMDQHEPLLSGAEKYVSVSKAVEREDYEVLNCSAFNAKRKPCKGKRMEGWDVCNDHKARGKKINSSVALEPEEWDPISEEKAKLHPMIQEQNDSAADAAIQSEQEIVATAASSSSESDDEDSEESIIDEIDAVFPDDPETMEESEAMQHLRDVYNENDEDDDEFHDIEFEDENLNFEIPAQDSVEFPKPSAWSWDIELSRRWDLLNCVLNFDSVLLKKLSDHLSRSLVQARKEFHTAKVRASASVYEGEAIIGGTIVGAITRLEAIRSTNPFAILVEEASEVLEPLLFACLGPSTTKLELIGDHLQLQPSMMNKFEFEKVLNVNISLFERLIKSPEVARVPQNVLSVQRRMRPNISAFTKSFYKDITEIIDDDQVTIRKIESGASSLIARAEGKGLLVPCISPQIFLWSHSGTQGKAHVGMSKINQTEADMVTGMVQMLVASGVPKQSIAVLTPYKGQLMLIKKCLEKAGYMNRYGQSSTDSCIASTIDRFQGDEADIVILSLVCDAKSKTPFVKLQNRMIVSLSRARIGMYILGNLGYFEGKSVQHWNQTLELLGAPSENDIDPKQNIILHAEDLHYKGSRIGSKLPICCPMHRLESTSLVSDPKKLILDFCKVVCTGTLKCSHPCGLDCHWPNVNDHNPSCNVMLESPCPHHTERIACNVVMKSARRSLAENIEAYQCRTNVELILHCSHKIELPCFEEVSITGGLMSAPPCTMPSFEPFIYPSCQHQIHLTCAKYQEYSSNAALAPRCDILVPFSPSCGHTVNVKCYMKDSFVSAQNFVCVEKVKVSLPRCHHIKSVSCKTASRLQGWSGKPIDIVGTVHEAAGYGGKDDDCPKQVQFVPKCGHSVKVSCSEAFELSETPKACSEIETITSPICGHDNVVITCSQKSTALAVVRTSPQVLEINEGDDMSSHFLIIPNLNLFCSTKVKFTRLCGHFQNINCSDVIKISRTSCKEMINIRSPLCGHNIFVPCDRKDSYNPWVQDRPSSVLRLLHDSIFEVEALPIPTMAPKDVSSIFEKCGESLSVERSCGHSFFAKCHEAFNYLTRKAKFPKCIETASKELECGHIVTARCDQLEHVSAKECKTLVRKGCLNYGTCKQLLDVKCGEPSSWCSFATEWTCPRGLHTFSLKLCSNGTPNACPDCSNKSLEEYIETVDAYSGSKEEWTQLLTNYPSFVAKLFKENEFSEEVFGSFLQKQATLLGSFANRAFKDVWKRPASFSPCFIPVFLELSNLQIQKVDFQFHISMLKNRTMPFNLLTIDNLSASKSENVLVGLVFACKMKQDAILPKKKGSGGKKKGSNGEPTLHQWINEQERLGFDCATLQDGTLVAFDPFCFIATHSGSVNNLLDKFEEFRGDETAIAYPTLVPIGYESARNIPTTVTGVDIAKGIIDRTIAKGLTLSTEWDGEELLPGRLGDELKTKLSFAKFNTKQAGNKKSTTPYGGIKFLDSLLESDGSNLLLVLLKALECDYLKAPESSTMLEKYVKGTRLVNTPAHPLLLLCLARKAANDGSSRNAEDLISILFSMFPKSVMFLSQKELQWTQRALSQIAAIKPVDCVEKWEQLKSEKGFKSKAMEKLLSMVGLKKVKNEAISLFKLAYSLSKMSPEQRANNSIPFNKVFAGNPGSGKTVVARLFAEILFDSGIRKSSTFIETSAQELMDNGADKFQSLISSANEGVIFIDEAYLLDPSSNAAGRSIVSHLLTASENLRDSLVFILAGYSSDIQDKLFSYNDGFESRFKEITFDDFEERELEEIAVGMLKKKGFAYDPRIPSTIAKKLILRAGKKGFGNARSLRSIIDDAYREAFDSKPDDVDLNELQITLEHFVGEHPKTNQKLKAILKEFEDTVGWNSIKKAVLELVEQATINYERQLEGQPILPIIMNRMFLGNPGTGKTTCASKYGRLLKELHYLSRGDVIVKTASDFIGSHIGESQKNTNAILKLAAGKVLVIDEAYCLDDNYFGKQALDVLVEKVQGTPSDDMAVLLLGYEKPMLDMLRTQNPGLARRFPKEFSFMFEDYTNDEFVKIFNNHCEKESIKCSSYEVVDRVISLLSKQRTGPNFGNVGSLKLLIQGAVAKAVSRSGNGNTELIPEDVDTGIVEGEDPFAPLDELVNIDNIKAQLQALKNFFVVAETEGGEPPQAGHFVFTGSPGTGKTTVARVMAKILFQLGILATTNIVQTAGIDMMASYVGQTGPKVKEMLGRAKGGILFIDEAYELGKGHFSTEALTTLLAAMTDPEYDGLIIIIAGYANDINGMLDRNQGLKSRFTNFFEFHDFDIPQSVEFFQALAKKELFAIADDVDSILCDGFRELMNRPGWGNGRDVNKVWQSTLKNRSNRVVKRRESQKTICGSDVSSALEEVLASRASSPLYRQPDSFNYQMAPAAEDPGRQLSEIAELASEVAQAEEESQQGRSDIAQLEEEEVEEVPPVQEESEDDDSKDKEDFVAAASRDAGVSDEIWNALCLAKIAERKAEEERLEAYRKQLEDLEKLRLIALAEKEEQKRLERLAELERIRKENEEREKARIRKAAAVQEKLRCVGLCPAGFVWTRQGSGWRCAAGGHFVSDEQLNLI